MKTTKREKTRRAAQAGLLFFAKKRARRQRDDATRRQLTGAAAHAVARSAKRDAAIMRYLARQTIRAFGHAPECQALARFYPNDNGDQ